MNIEKNVEFEEVSAAFLLENPITDGTNSWAFNAIAAANQQFGRWARATLILEDILSIMLPHHLHDEQEVVPKCCSTVSEAIEKLKSIPPSAACPKWIDEISTKPESLIFLSMGPNRSSGLSGTN